MANNHKISFRLDAERRKGLESRCEHLGCCPSDYLRGLIDVDLEETQEATPNKQDHPDYGNLPDNFDGSAHVISLDRDGDARTTVKNSDGTTRTWIKNKGSEEWIPVARLIYRV